jgi:hypothetical protein
MVDAKSMEILFSTKSQLSSHQKSHPATERAENQTARSRSSGEALGNVPLIESAVAVAEGAIAIIQLEQASKI